jgi:NAD(P)-dependent dehydrogenase (short-subunit alcohol dehydrogenase family)
MKVAGKVVLVTGGGSGIGQQLVLALLARGAEVAAADVNADGLDATRTLAAAGNGRLSVHQADVSRLDSVIRLAEDVVRHHGRIDAIINNAGIIHPFKPLIALDGAQIDRVINVNLYGTLNVIRTFLPLLLQRPDAHIVNVSSMGGLFAFPNQAVYGASKAAVKILSEGLSSELCGTSVGVTVVYPGAVATAITRNCDAHNEKFERIQRLFSGTPPEKAAAVIISAMERRKFSVLIGIDAMILHGLYRMFPRFTIGLVAGIMKLATRD